MASASGLVIPLCLFFIGTRLWALGKKFGHVTQVQYFRDRWECSHIGTVIFALTATMLVPYIIIGVMGGGHTLEALTTVMGADGKPVLQEVLRDGRTVMETKHWVSYEVGGAIVALVVMSYVFFGGMRGTAWVNTFQTLLFLGFGAIAFVLISKNLGGFDRIMSELAADPKTAPLLTRQRIPMEEFFSYTLIPLSAIMFPHIAIMCMTAEKVSSFKKTIIFYPICILLIWLPCVVLGVVAAHQFPGLKIGESDDVILRLLTSNTGPLLAGMLGAAIMACVMASDSQILALCTMFSQDVFAHYGGGKRFGDKAQVWTGRIFVIIITTLWKRSTKWGALAATLWVGFAMLATWWLYDTTAATAPKPGQPFVQIFPALGDLFLRSPSNVLVYGYLPVLPMVLGSAFFMVLGSLFTKPPGRTTLEKYFPAHPETPMTTRKAASQSH
jgi:SSS family solute:Na+ symporter